MKLFRRRKVLDDHFNEHHEHFFVGMQTLPTDRRCILRLRRNVINVLIKWGSRCRVLEILAFWRSMREPNEGEPRWRWSGLSARGDN